MGKKASGNRAAPRVLTPSPPPFADPDIGWRQMGETFRPFSFLFPPDRPHPLRPEDPGRFSFAHRNTCGSGGKPPCGAPVATEPQRIGLHPGGVGGGQGHPLAGWAAAPRTFAALWVDLRRVFWRAWGPGRVARPNAPVGVYGGFPSRICSSGMMHAGVNPPGEVAGANSPKSRGRRGRGGVADTPGTPTTV